MYDTFYKVVENPFKICTDARFLWCGDKHSQVLSSLIYGLMDHNGLVVLTGKIGTGKTTLVNALLNILGNDVCVVKINHSTVDAVEFLAMVAKSLDPNFTGTGKSDLLPFIESFFGSVRAEGKIVLLVVDEAQHLSKEVLEEIRLLSNMEQSGQRILSVMLVGQTEFMPMLLSSHNRSLRQRVTLFCEIQDLSQEETRLYVEYRLKVSGMREQLFTSRALQMIHTFSRGNPRLINILCDRAMRIGYMKKHKKIDADIITECARDMNLCNPVKVRILEFFGPEFQTWWNELPTKLKRRLAMIGPSLQKAQSWIHRQGQIILPKIRSKTKKLTDNLIATSGRLLRENHSRNHRFLSVWMAGIGIIAIGLSISAYKMSHGRKQPNASASKTVTSLQETATPNTGVLTKRTSENPTLLISTSPSTSQLWHRNPANITAVSDRKSAPEEIPPLSQPVVEEPKLTPMQLATFALEQKNYQKAIELLEARPKTGTEEDRKATGVYANALMGRALEVMTASPSKAEGMLLKVVDIAPNNAEAYLSLGKYFTRTKKYDQAIDAYRNAIRLDPQLSDALFNLGYIFASTGKLEDAETAFSGAVQLNPPYLGKSLFNLAVVQQKLGKKKQSLANLEKAVAMMPQNEKALSYLHRVKETATGSTSQQGHR